MSNPSPGALAQLFELVGSRGLRLVADKALGPGLFTELPPADEADSVRYAVVQGGEGVADQEYLCRKNADGTFTWVPKAITEVSLVLAYFQAFDEATSPTTISAVDAAALSGSMSLASYRQGRLRATVASGTAGVIDTVEYYDAEAATWQALLTNTFDFGDPSTTTEWEDLPVGVLGPEAYVALRTSVTGTGSANATVSVFLDVRG